MVDTSRGRTVYSTGKGQVCPRCGWPVKACRCSSAIADPVPSVIVAKLRIERAGRGGRTVTVVDNLPHSPDFLRELVRDLKRACGAGGTVTGGRVEIQGDHRERLRELLCDKGWTVKG